MVKDEKVAVILVNYNGAWCLEECVDSLCKQNYANLDIVIVDNNSSDMSAENVKRKYDNIILLKQNKNLGFAGGNNVGIFYTLKAGYEYIMLLNTDMEVAEDLVSTLVTYTKRDTATIPTIYEDRGKRIVGYCGGEFDWEKGKSIQRVYSNVTKPQEVSFMTGACMMFHRETLEVIGGFDESFYMYYEDDDICMRLKLSNIEMLYVPATWAWHKIMFRSRQRDYVKYYVTRNSLLFLHKYSKYFSISVREKIVQYINEMAKNRKAGKQRLNKFIIRGIFDYLFHRYGRCNWVHQQKHPVNMEHELYLLMAQYAYSVNMKNYISDYLKGKGIHTIAFVGQNHTTECLCEEFMERGIHIAYIIGNPEKKYGDIPIVARQDILGEVDCVICTQLVNMVDDDRKISEILNCKIYSVKELLNKVCP